MAENDPLKLFLFTDEPARDLGGDHLALRPFSSMVAAAALTNRGPFNIGVFSGWGQGKTSVLRQAQALIQEQDKPNVITAWVNAWQYEHEAHPIVPLLAIIINEITKAIDARKTLGEKENAALAKTFGDLKRALRSIAYGFSAKAGAKIPGFANLEIGFVAKDMIDRDDKLSSDRDPLLDQSLYYHAYERIESFRDQLAKANPADQPKIIVFIDDLDRCLPSKALHLLESLKLVLAQPGFIFVLGVDRHVIDSFLTKRYHREFGIARDRGHGQQYMDKIIQLPLDLPHHQNRFEKYIDALTAKAFYDHQLPEALFQIFSSSEDAPRFKAALAAGCDRNPRTLIRTLNYLLTDLFLRENQFFNQKIDPFISSAEFLQFAAVSRITRLTFGSVHGHLFRQIVGDRSACDDLADHFSGESTVADTNENPKLEGLSPPPSIFQPLNQPQEASINTTNFGKGISIRGPIQPSKEIPLRYRSVIAHSTSLHELFRTALGQRWLKEHEKRQSIEGFLAIREEPVPAPDETALQIINAAIRRKLDLPEGPIGDDDRKKITDFDLGFESLSDLSPLQSLTSLQRLSVFLTQVSNLSPLQSLTSLRYLDLNGTLVRDLSPLQSLTGLQKLDLSSTLVSDFTSLQSLTDLHSLFLSHTKISDLTPLKSLAKLQELSLTGTQVIDVTPLQGLANILEISLADTNVDDLTALYSLKGCLKRLVIIATPVSRNEDALAALREALPETQIII